jgi:hypothetical protein
MTEGELQQAIEGAIQDPAWAEAIEGQEELRKAVATQSHELFVPSFPIDYMIRKRLVSAAAYVLDRLKTASVVSTSRSNISLDAAAETFYPDLLLIDESRGQVIIVELKRSRQTERQALTELLATSMKSRTTSHSFQI